jgi:hypothetical protein
MTFDIIDKSEAKRLLGARLNNEVKIYGLDNDSAVIFSHVLSFDNDKCEYLAENATRILHFHYNDNPECGRQVDFKFVASGMTTYFTVQLQKILPVCNLDNKDLLG